MDGLSATASIFAVIDISAKIASLCFQYAAAVKDAKKDIERLRKKVIDIERVLEGIKQLLDGWDEARLVTTHKLSNSLKECLRQLEDLEKRLEPGKTHKVMRKVGLQALRWPFTSKQVDKIVADLERYEQTFCHALQVDQTERILDIDQKLDFMSLPTAKGASFDSHIDEHDARCLENTRVELLRHIREWTEDKNGKSIYWLNGMAGTGKSTIARTIAQSLADQRQLGASFFFKKGEAERGNATRFVTTIAANLMAHVPGLKSEIKKAIDADPAISEKFLKDQFEKLILHPLSETQRNFSQALELFVVIDALDECEREEDIRLILQLLAQTRNIRPILIRVFVTSRPELPIRLGFRKMPDGTYQDLVLHEVSKKTIEHDIALFLKHKLGEIQEQRSLSRDWPSRDQIQALAELAIPLFIFAATACRYIGDLRDNPKKRLDIILQYQTSNQVSTLDKTYLPILNQLFDDEDEADKQRRTSEFREIVGSIIVLESPLSITSLARLLDISKEDVSCRLDSLHSVLGIPVDEDLPVRLLHLSFRDFLVDPQKRGKSSFWIDETETHKTLASKCLQLMSSPKGLKQDMCNLSVPGTLRNEIDNQTINESLPPDLRYACRYWVHHFEQSQNRICDGDLVHTFLQKYFLYWLEALSLIGEASESIRMIGNLQSLVNPDQSAITLEFLHDAKRFTLRNRSILENAPLQLYSSALIFTPEMSIIRKTFSPKWITRLSKAENDWDALLQTLEGHWKGVTTVAFSPDGQLVASASYDSTVRLWETATGSCLSTLKGHSSSVNAVAFSPDGQLVASASNDHTVRLWEVAMGCCRSTLEGHSGKFNAVAFSPDGQLVASASYDSTVRLWETATGSCLSTLEGHSSSVNAVAFSPDSQLVASASFDGTVRLWKTATGSCRSTLEGHSNWVIAVAFSPDGQLVASASEDCTVRLWETATACCCSTLEGHSGRVTAVAFSPDGQLVVSASGDGTVQLWEIATGCCRSTLEGRHSGWINAVPFSPDGQLAASASDDCTVRLWGTATGSCRSTLEGHSDAVTAAAFSPDGQLVASASNDGTVRLWEIATGCCLSTLEGRHSNLIAAVAFSPDGQLAASASYDSTVRLWETATGSCRSTLEGHSKWVTAVAFSPDGQLVASASGNRTVRLWETATECCRSTLEGHWSWVTAVAFSPDGQLVASASGDGTVRLWETATGSCRSTLEGHSNRVTAVAFSPDSQLVASASDDRTVRLWETATGSCRSTLKGHSKGVIAVAFSPDSQLVASASEDGTVRLWETATGFWRSTLKLEGRWSIIIGVAFVPDGLYLRTDIGQIPLSLPVFSTSSCQERVLPTVFINDEWITTKEQPLLWIPPEYRSEYGTVYGDIICLVHSSQFFTFLKIHREEMVR